MASLVEGKRQHFYQEIRERQKRSAMEKIRYQVMKNQRTKILAELIQSTTLSINQHQFRSLLHLIANNETDAMILLGNLLLDEKVNIQMIRFYQTSLVLPQNKYRTWILAILSGKRYFPQNFDHYLYESIAFQKSQFSLEYGLNLLKQNFKKHPHKILTFIHQKQAMNTIRILCLSGEKNLRKLAFQILSKITSKNNVVKELGRIFNTHIIHEIMLSGIFSGSSVIRALVVRVVNNLVISDYTIVDWVIYENILSRVLKEKENVKIEISYLLYNFICSDEYERIKKAVKDGLVRTLHEYSILQNEECRKNVQDCALCLSKRFRQEQRDDREVYLELISYNLYIGSDDRMDQQ